MSQPTRSTPQPVCTSRWPKAAATLWTRWLADASQLVIEAAAKPRKANLGPAKRPDAVQPPTPRRRPPAGRVVDGRDVCRVGRGLVYSMTPGLAGNIFVIFRQSPCNVAADRFYTVEGI